MAEVDAETVLLVTADNYSQFLIELDGIKKSFEGEHAKLPTAQQERAHAAVMTVIALLQRNGDKEQAELFWPLFYGLQSVLSGVDAELFRPINKVRGLDFGKRMLASEASACVDWLKAKRNHTIDSACQFVAECLIAAGYDFRIQHRSLDKGGREAAQVKEWRKNIREKRHSDPENDQRDNYDRVMRMLAPFDLAEVKIEELKRRFVSMFKISLGRSGIG